MFLFFVLFFKEKLRILRIPIATFKVMAVTFVVRGWGSSEWSE